MADYPVRLIWSLAQAANLSTSISGAGNSGGWAAPNPPQQVQNARTPVDLRWADDLWLSVSAAGGSGTLLKVQLNFFDDQGNLYSFVTGTTPFLGVSITAAPGSQVAFGGRHGGGGSGNYFVCPEWGQVSWTATGTFTGVEIALYNRG